MKRVAVVGSHRAFLDFIDDKRREGFKEFSRRGPGSYTIDETTYIHVSSRQRAMGVRFHRFVYIFGAWDLPDIEEIKDRELINEHYRTSTLGPSKTRD